MRLKVPGLSERLAAQVVAFVQGVRQQELYKLPGVSETLDWAEALTHLATERLEAETVQTTLGFLLKNQDDVDRLSPLVGELLGEG